MNEPRPQSVFTELLQSAAAGDASASGELLPVLYDELRRLARTVMARTPPGQTLQPTALVHEAYLKLIGPGDRHWQNRGHFMGAAARAMRNILVDQARRKSALKRGADREKLELSTDLLEIEPPSEDILALDEALDRLEQEFPRKAKIVFLRYFAGLTGSEIAEAMELSPATVDREWRFARAWLFDELSHD